MDGENDWRVLLSPSARREWVETTKAQDVAATIASPSARREWVETHTVDSNYVYGMVSLREEGVG